MRRTLAILALSGLVAAVVGSASDLIVRGETIQAGTSTDATCDPDGIDANWGLETDDNTVGNVRFSGVHADCLGADMWAEVYGGVGNGSLFKGGPVQVAGDSVNFSFPAPLTPESIQSVRVWIEG